MELESARELKLDVLGKLSNREPFHHRGRKVYAHALAARPSSTMTEQSVTVDGIGIGIAAREPGGFLLAIRLQRETRETERVVTLIEEMARGEVDTRVVGRVRSCPHGTVPPPRGVPGPPPRKVPGPLARGASIGHFQVTAGTLGAFVTVAGTPGTHVLSNNHVLAANNSGQLGDPILHPAPADGGIQPDHVIGVLSGFVSLDQNRINFVDAAVCRLEDHVPRTPDSGMSEGPPAQNGTAVEKKGRTSQVTHGTVTAFEMDIQVNMGGMICDFNDQIEVAGTDGEPFCRPGDSGSLVCRQGTLEAVGLLFAGAERGLSYINPIDRVLRAFDTPLSLVG